MNNISTNKKIGRPLSENPKNERLQIRVDKDTIALLDDCAKKSGTNRSDVVRKGIERIAEDLKGK